MFKPRILRLSSAVVVSFLSHGLFLALFLALIPSSRAVPEVEAVPLDTDRVIVDPMEPPTHDARFEIETDPSLFNPSAEINYPSERSADASIPGDVNPDAKVGSPDGSPSAPPTSLPPPPGLGGGTGAAAEAPGGGLNALNRSTVGGYHGSSAFPGRGNAGESAGSKQRVLEVMGGSPETEAAVGRGLQWLVRQQSPDGRWLLDGPFPDKGSSNDTAGTALGLLPFLGAGKTHKPAKENKYDKAIERGLRFLVNRQDKRTGDLGGGMYGHGLATIALCEAYGLTQDPWLRKHADKAVNFILQAQHEGGGWRYSPGQAGDLSVTGWQVMALKSAQMAGLTVPPVALKKAERFFDSVANAESEGYGYVSGSATPTMTAVGLLCRQFVQAWGPQNPRLIKGINTHLKTSAPGAKKDIYYYYYATQVMYHFGGDAWKSWNDKMRELLVKGQEANPQSPQFGSWSSAGDVWGGNGGGRLMVTSLNLLTLEVYYRYLPLYYRDREAKNGMAQNAP